MSPAPIKTPSRRLLLLLGTLAVVVAGIVAGIGIMSRADANRQLAQWTAQQALPTVQIATLDRSGAGQTLVLPGNIQAYNKAPIYARVPGYLKSWNEDIGAHVKAGQLLASIDTPDLDQQFVQARANLASAEANERLAAVTAQRWQSLANSQWVSRQANDEKAGDAAAKKAIADAARANVAQLEALQDFKKIVAPFDGVVTARNTDIGALINAGSGSAVQALFEVSDLHKIRIYVQVPQAFTAQIHPGLKATFEVPQYPGQQFDASVVAMSNAMDASSRSMLVQLQADNADGKFAQGTYCRVDFQLPAAPGVVQVPATALIPANQGAQVAVLGDGNKVVLKTVQIGRDLGNSVEVVAGLSPSDRVIDSPPETLQSGDAVQLAATAPAPGEQQAGAQSPADQPATKTD
jgi:RND family efflux transporter MFP subunit